MRRLLAPLALVGVLLVHALFAGGCSPLRKTVMPADVPHTVIFVSGPVDTVNHIVHLHWFGTDPHGYIAGYEVRMLNPLAPADSAWHFTVHTDSILTVYTPTGYVAPVFEVRAINDQGVRDPNPARELFQFKNLPPIVKLVTKPISADHSDTTFASVTVTWSVNDPDGNAAAVICRMWLDGQAASPLVVTGTSFTMPSSRFLVNGAYTTGRRTLYIQGIDDGGMEGPVDSVTWYVKSPVTGARARLLLVDDIPSTVTIKHYVDTLYTNAVARAGAAGGVAPDQYRVLHLQYNQPFRSAKDLEQTFKLFEAVIWYRGEQTAFSTLLDSYAIGPNGEGLGPYLDGGGKLFIESLNPVNSWSSYGPLPQSFIQRYLNCSGTFQFAQAPDSSGSWGLPSSGVLQVPGVSPVDSLQNRRILGGLRGFVANNASQVLITVPPNLTTPPQPRIAMPVAMAVPQAGGGIFILDTYPLISASISTPGFPERASLVLDKIFRLLGLTVP